MEYEYQIISLPIGESSVEKSMPMPLVERMQDYTWRQEAGATAVLMHFVRLGWEPVSTLGLTAGAASILLRKRLVASARGGPH